MHTFTAIKVKYKETAIFYGRNIVQNRINALPLQCVFHGIRFKVNKKD